MPARRSRSSGSASSSTPNGSRTLRRIRRRHPALRHDGQLLLRAPPRGADRDLDRPLPQPARAEGSARGDLTAGRDAGGDPERDPRLLGDPGRWPPSSQEHVEPLLHDKLGFIPLFGPPQTTGASVFTASLILTIMIVPIIASISRDLFLSVPRTSRTGPAPSARPAGRSSAAWSCRAPPPGVVAASLLGLGRALGEAIAVTQVIGAGSDDQRLAVRNRRHPGRAHRQPVPGGDHGAAPGLALLPRRDPARDRPGLQPGRPVDRQALRLPGGRRDERRLASIRRRR